MRYYTLKTVAREFGVTEATVKNWIKRGLLEATKGNYLMGGYYISDGQLLDFQEVLADDKNKKLRHYRCRIELFLKGNFETIDWPGNEDPKIIQRKEEIHTLCQRLAEIIYDENDSSTVSDELYLFTSKTLRNELLKYEK